MDTVMPRWRPSLKLGLVAVLAAAAALRLWRLSQNGFTNEYYSAGVRSMSQSWHNFAYNSFDPAGFISIDKPPVALWIQVASVRLFGFHPLSVLVPRPSRGSLRSRCSTIWFDDASARPRACSPRCSWRSRRSALRSIARATRTAAWCSAEPYDPSGLVSFLEANRRDGRFLLATTTTRLAAPIIIGSGHAVMAMGGFHGLDPIVTPEKLARMVEAGHVRFVMLGDALFISRPPLATANP